MLHIQKKFWKHVEDALQNIEDTSSYFVGGTLSLSLGKNKAEEPTGICLNISGRGFVLRKLKNTTLYQPDFITALVRDIYLRYKGNTEYLKKVVGNG